MGESQKFVNIDIGEFCEKKYFNNQVQWLIFQ